MICQVPPAARPAQTLRRLPRQERSRRRVDAILDAAARIFADRGFEGATTEEIAARAGTSIGSLYQFFPHKPALFQALAERCLTRSRGALETLLAAHQGAPWTALLDTLIDGFVALRAADPGFRAILVNVQLYGTYARADAELRDAVVRRIQRLFRGYAPGLSPAERRRAAALIVQVVTGMLVFAPRGVPDRETIEETKVLLRRYLAPVLGPAAPRRQGEPRRPVSTTRARATGSGAGAASPSRVA